MLYTEEQVQEYIGKQTQRASVLRGLTAESKREVLRGLPTDKKKGEFNL